jgi:hypothetical protein
VVQLHRDLDKIHAAGAELYVIGNGSPSFIEGFREETKWTGPIYTDPSLAVYKAAELKRGVTKTLNPFALGGTVKAFMAGNRQGRTQGDAWQQGGALVIGTDGSVLWHHISDRPDDIASGPEILDALTSRSRAQL